MWGRGGITRILQYLRWDQKNFTHTVGRITKNLQNLKNDTSLMDEIDTWIISLLHTCFQFNLFICLSKKATGARGQVPRIKQL